MTTSKKTEAPEDSEKVELSGAWKQVQLAIWLIGLAILAWQSWWWPGILVLVAISGLYQAAVQAYLSRQESRKELLAETEELDKQRAAWLPATCPSCGGPINVQTVVWTGAQTGACPYCSAHLKP